MKIVLWLSFYFISFLALIVGLYFSKDRVIESTTDVPVLNYTKYHMDAVVEDSVYTEKIDSLAVVVEGLLNEMTEYVSQLQDKDSRINQLQFELDKLKRENTGLHEEKKNIKTEKENFNKAQEEQKLQELAKILGSMKPDVLKPILANLPDNLVQIFYDKAKQKDRVKIFNALPADRAGKILTELATN